MHGNSTLTRFMCVLILAMSMIYSPVTRQTTVIHRRKVEKFFGSIEAGEIKRRE
jgi:hypothetical protein